MKLVYIVLTAMVATGCNFAKPMGGTQTTEFFSLSEPPTGGSTVPGKGALSVPTGEAIVARVQNGLEGRVSSLNTNQNFSRALAQVKSNLPQVTDPLKATGYDQVQLLVYAACSDLTTGTTPLMQSVYNVRKADSIATSKAALVSAGMRMLDRYVGGLASQSSATTDVNKAFDDIVAKTNVTGNTSTIAFMSVCIAANTAGSSMMGF